ncbi:CRISPR-associated protein, Cas6 family [Orenia metallireducens]|uniref:CRISPR-associated protein, Cas6 family n=1 Tax=Orenia metallireducens TaxID=1413210 RepID=A0A285HZG3_9FIRM|nr:CRISPR-associated endoribonuclease Cas6 [Orenia metallireducens]SNY41115.1 CRISPR-associated protein, Cas6 family [Orenia metallireducens]
MFYSVIVRFYAKRDIYFSYYPAESWHGMLFKMLRKQDKDKTTILHDEYEGKPFTISPILPYLRWRKDKKYLKGGKKYFVRITFLEEQWYHLFMEYFLYQREKLELNGRELEIIEVLTNAKEDKRCNAISGEELWDNSRINRKIKLKFHSTTSFRVDEKHVIFPQGEFLFNSLLSKWKEYGDKELVVNSQDFGKINISRYKLESAMEQFKDYPIKGFRGYCEYELEAILSDKKVKEINLLSDFAFYSGVGYKTTMGLGQVARIR